MQYGWCHIWGKSKFGGSVPFPRSSQMLVIFAWWSKAIGGTIRVWWSGKSLDLRIKCQNLSSAIFSEAHILKLLIVCMIIKGNMVYNLGRISYFGKKIICGFRCQKQGFSNLQSSTKSWNKWLAHNSYLCPLWKSSWPSYQFSLVDQNQGVSPGVNTRSQFSENLNLC